MQNLKAQSIRSNKYLQPQQHFRKQDINKLDSFAKFEGILRGQWYREDGKLQSICYGSAIAISKRVILTCAHSVYLQKKRKVCDSVKFIPNHKQGRIKGCKIYKSAEQQFIRFQQMKTDQTFTKGPIPEDIALVYLSEDLELDNFLEVGTNDQKDAIVNNQLLISGFPSIEYYTETNLKSIYFKQNTLNGKLLEISDHTIYHNLQTQTGHSGSGILGINSTNKKPTVLGVHTHKGKRKNSGVYLNKFLLRRLARYEIQFGLFHKDYQMDIKFPLKYKQQAYEQLDLPSKEILSKKSQFYEKLFYKYDYQNSQIPVIFTTPEQQEQQQMQLSIIHQQKEIDQRQQISNLIRINTDLKKSIYQQNNHMQILQKWLKLQNHFLKVFQTLQHGNVNKILQKQVRNNLILLCTKIEQQLSQVKEKIQKMDKIDIIYNKFASVSQHLSIHMANSIDQLDHYTFQQQEQQYQRFEEQFKEYMESSINLSFQYNKQTFKPSLQ